MSNPWIAQKAAGAVTFVHRRKFTGERFAFNFDEDGNAESLVTYLNKLEAKVAELRAQLKAQPSERSRS